MFSTNEVIINILISKKLLIAHNSKSKQSSVQFKYVSFFYRISSLVKEQSQSQDTMNDPIQVSIIFIIDDTCQQLRIEMQKDGRAIKYQQLCRIYDIILKKQCQVLLQKNAEQMKHIGMKQFKASNNETTKLILSYCFSMKLFRKKKYLYNDENIYQSEAKSYHVYLSIQSQANTSQ
ncbi:hypothetical protein ABPG73_023072 [Tetrahymena malaccensis]